jgi:dienelactone hydrolase
MSPRRNQRRRDGRQVDEVSARGGVELEYGGEADDAWNVRQITAAGATKAYRCPGCDHEILPGVAHVVAWPADGRGDATDRRHWHTACWRARHRRQPTRKHM